MKSKIFYLVFILLSFLSATAQQKTVTGRVTGDTGNPLSGVTVTVKGTKIVALTNNDGEYSISVPNGNNTLIFTYVGSTTQSINIAGKTTADVFMEQANSTLSDVVVIGYATVPRKNLSSSVSSVSAKDLKDIPINSAAEALNGRLAGVTATTSEGSPDAQVRIRVRGGMSITGDNNPLYIIDGVQVENGLNLISPQDIQSIDVLKDAAATAIYGARGANGVIVITTKSGKPGRFILSYNGYAGFKNLAKELGVFSPYDYVVYQSERSRGSSTDSANFLKNFGGTTFGTTSTWDSLNAYKDIPAVDWQHEVFGRTGFMTTQNLSASGGNNKVTYNVGYTYNGDKAIVLNSKYQRHLVSAKVDYNVMKGLKVGLSARFNHQDVYGAGVSSEQGSSYSRLRNAVKYRPFLSPGLDLTSIDPLADPNPGNGLGLVNPIDLANAEYQKKTTNDYNGSVYASYNITKNLSFRSTFGYDENHFINRQFSDSITPLSNIQGGTKPVIQLDTVITKTITNSNVFTYSLKNLNNKHNIDLLVGEETYDLKTESRNNLYRNYPNAFNITTSAVDYYKDAFTKVSLATPFAGYPKLRKTRYTNLSFFGRLSYSYMDKYLFSANLRADGGSKFSEGKKWGYFPSASFAWRVKKEEFLQDVKGISDLKFRVGYGTVGNNRIPDYLFIPTFSSSTYYYGVNGLLVPAYSSVALANPELQWESTVNRNYGVDLSLFNSRLNISFDIYNNTSDKLLLTAPIDPSFGYVTQQQNIGKTSNKGVELQLNATILKGRNNLSWSANFNISHNRNTIVSLATNQQQFLAQGYSGVSGQQSDYIEKIGSPVGSMYGLVTDGFYKVSDFNFNTQTSVYTLKSGIVSDAGIIGTVQPGSIRFKDLNGDGTIDFTNDRTIIGDPTAKFTGGLNQQFTYKNWDASVFVNFSSGNDVYNANKLEFTNSYQVNSNMLSIMNDRWKVITPNGQTAQYVNGSGQVVGIPPDQLAALNVNATLWQPLKSTGAFVTHSWAIEDGSFLRFNNVTLGYSIPVKNLAKIKITKLRVYATANNLAIITNYTGYDPEVSVRTSQLTPNLDYSAYPKSRSFLFGVNATF